MKQWTTPEITELDINETANGIVPGTSEAGWTNDGLSDFFEWVEDAISGIFG